MKRFTGFLILILFVQLQFLSAQETKLRVAVFDPSSSGTTVDEGIKVAVRELISSTFVNTGKYTMVERSLLDKVMTEMAFSNTEVVDDSQATEIGKLAGANKVVLSVVTLVGSRNMLSIKTIDVQTATIDLQKTRVVSSKELLDIVEPLTLEMLGENSSAKSSSTVSKKTAASEKPAPSSSNSNEGQNIVLEFEGILHSKNPTVKIFVDKNLVGEGTLNEGFSITFTEDARGVHQVKIEWSDFVDTKTFKINTNRQTRFTFQYVRGGFGYEFKLK
jgi:hypothetical protein